MILENVYIADDMPFSQRTITEEGFLEAPATLARTGIHIYRAGEFPQLVAQGMDVNQVLRLHRPAEELFNPATMKKAESMPIIVEPHQHVTSANWKDIAVGDVHGIHRNGDLMDGKVLIKDKDAIDLVQSGKKYTSNGYTFTLDLTPGTNAAGDAYDGIQRNIVPNHMVICDSPRGGTRCQIADTNPTGENRIMIMQIDGISVEVGNDTAVSAVRKVIEERDALKNKPATPASVTLKVGDASKTITGEQAIITELTARDTEIAALKAQVKTPEQINKMVGDAVKVRVAIIGDATKLVKDFAVGDKDNITIQREVITSLTSGDTAAKAVADALLKTVKLDAADANLVDTVFSAVVAAAGKPGASGSADPDPAVARAMAGDTNPGAAAEPKLIGRDAFLARQNNAWQGATKKQKK